jgi:hypothetical protein
MGPESLDHKFLLTEDESFEFLNRLGLPIGRSTFHKICAGIGNKKGPPVSTTWLGRRLRDPVQLVEWALTQCDPPPPALKLALDDLRAQRATHRAQTSVPSNKSKKAARR